MDFPRQLGLAITLREEMRFSNFVLSSAQSDELLSYLCNLAEGFCSQSLVEKVFFLWGLPGSGLSHLLHASCHSFVDRGLAPIYVPLAELIDHSPASICEGLEHYDLICIDDVHLLAAKPEWQQALFHLFNRAKDKGKLFISAAHVSPTELEVELADLYSRLFSGSTFQVHILDEAALKHAFQQRAAERGIELSDEVANFIFLRTPRSPQFIFDFLEKLDKLSLAEKRKITIPFVRQVFQSLT